MDHYILCIETSTTNCSVALANNGKVILVKEDYNTGYSHAESLHVFIEQLLKEAKVNLNQLSAIAVSKGPGSYTGLRIGVSAAKGLCYALNIPLISVNTLDSLVRQAGNISNGYIVPMLDARRMEVYSATYNNSFDCISETEALILNEESYTDLLSEKQTIFIGNGVTKFKEICVHPNAVFIENKLPSAKELARVSFEKFKTKNFENVAYFEPFYLKDFVAGKKKS